MARIKNGLQKSLFLGNLDAKRDWGHARDYVEVRAFGLTAFRFEMPYAFGVVVLQGMWAILQHDKGDDFVLATGETHTVREFVEEAFKCVDINIKYVDCFLWWP